MLLSLSFVAVEEVQVKVAIDTVKCTSQGSTMVPSSESVVPLAVEGIDRTPNGDPLLCWIQLQVGRQCLRVPHFSLCCFTNVT